MALGVTATVCAVAWQPVATFIAETRLSLAVAAARGVGAAKSGGARLSGPREGSWQAAIAARLTRHETRAATLANRILTLVKDGDGDDGARARGVAFFVAGDCRRAVDAFASVRSPDARDWNDLAAAQLCLAYGQRRPDPWLTALVSADRALATAPSPAEARFNRARILEFLGVGDAAGRYARSERVAWRAAYPRAADRDALARLTRTYPEVARRFAENAYLPSWAESMRSGDTVAARATFERIRIIAETLRRDTGEALLDDTIRAIDRRGAGEALLDGLVAYGVGGQAIAADDFPRGEKKLAAADFALRAAGSPLAGMARFYLALAMTEQTRFEEARRLLEPLAGDGAPPSHRALHANADYELALIDAQQGRWSASLARAQRSYTAFSALRERNNAVTPQEVLSEDYDMIGQRELAWSHGVDALRDACAVGDVKEARLALAVLCRTALRAGDDARARSLTLIEEELAAITKIPRLDPDMFLRRAIAEWRLEDITAARAALVRARQAAITFPGILRTKLVADVDAAEGALVRRRDPLRAVALLSAAIEFQRLNARSLMLPEWYLQRGRAWLQAGDAARAAADFDAGIEELERQRGHVADDRLRAGIFDDAAALFDEAIAIRVSRNDAEGAFEYIERGRARSVLEQLNARDLTLRIPHIADVQRGLSRGEALVEYAALPERLIALVITCDRAVMRELPATRSALRTAASRAAADLQQLLLAPIEIDLHDISSLNFVSDDVLERVPFAALFGRASRRYLIETHEVATSPSAGVFLATRTRARRLSGAAPARALIFGNPTIPRDEVGDLASLPGSEYEARRTARKYPAAALFVRDEATAERFIETAPRYDVVYFAGHGLVNEVEPYASALVCAASSRHPGSLTAADIARLHFDATRVVVLAACGTMRGGAAPVEGTPSLSRAFLVAGVPAVVGTLWDVDDDKTAAIMRPLHEQLARGATPAAALRAAQLEAIRRNIPVREWSAFAVMGAN